MTPKIKEYAEKLYPTSDETYYHDVALQNAFKGGFRLGAEFAEWTSCNGWFFDNDTEMWWHEGNGKYEYSEPSTAELIDIFLTEKMKEHEK